MPYGVDVAKQCKEFTNVHQGSIITNADLIGNSNQITPTMGTISGVGYIGVCPSGGAVEGRLTDRMDHISYY